MTAILDCHRIYDIIIILGGNMNKRIFKKVSTPFDQVLPEGAVLMINIYDPQLATIKVFLDAIKEKNLPFFAVANKLDLVKEGDKKIKDIERELKIKLISASLLKNKGLKLIKERIKKIFKKEKRIVILGVFNSGKTSLISKLTGKKLKISDLPGSTSEFTHYKYQKYTLIDTVGQVIDVNKPMMVSVDLSGCRKAEEKITRVLRADAEGILATLETAVLQIGVVVKVLKKQIAKGKKIVVVGAGASSLVAMEMCGQALETGMPAMVFTNNLASAQPVSFAKGIAEEEKGLSKYINLAVQKEDVVFGISASGGTGFVYDILRRARKKKAITVAITENPDTPMGKMADYIIKSNAKPEGPSSSKVQVAHLAIVHALCLVLADERKISADQSIGYMMRETVLTKKMGIK